MIKGAIISKPTFPLGTIIVTVETERLLTEDEISAYLARHSSGDWGDIGQDDKQMNRDAIERGIRIISGYRLPEDLWLTILTSGDRSYTKVLIV